MISRGDKTKGRALLLNDSLQEAILVLWGQKLRSILTLLGIMIGVGSVVGMVSIISGLNQSMSRQIASLGTGVLYVSKYEAQVQIGPSRRERRPDLTVDEARAIRQQAPAVAWISAQIERQETVEYRGVSTRTLGITAATEAFLPCNGYEVAEGRFISPADVAGRERVVVLGAGVKKILFPWGGGLGSWVRIGGQSYQVIGFLEGKGSFLGSSLDDLAVVPLPFFVEKTRYGESVDYFVVRPTRPEDADEARDQVSGVLRRLRGLRPNDPDNFGITSQARLLELYRQITSGFYMAMILISAIGLLVGGIGVMNMMLVAVGERTREIGLRRAIGARARDIMSQFLIEAAALTLLGGLAGIILGLLLAAGVHLGTHLPFACPLWVVVVSLSVSTGVGFVFGLYPAYRASRLNPIDALHYE
ncbi:MAG: ABC transporter permease [Candidatus Eisenbacteria bacterium]|uniref:ABC transporter permease n=1 Tax=Eiseniibacteriota bacterium TaxID=2212470 RepID=A0A948WBV6_UNCEI|nr:ABC transporter permease [Candidatus Eisenbacteria bacterium]MBU1947854.1 ABC transporter permease [Candidatus Eisenbacteria bacterium]MBU2690338.1 ABC transporter permease [Candidatus Eisenbacteria bacterium]